MTNLVDCFAGASYKSPAAATRISTRISRCERKNIITRWATGTFGSVEKSVDSAIYQQDNYNAVVVRVKSDEEGFEVKKDLQ